MNSTTQFVQVSADPAKKPRLDFHDDDETTLVQSSDENDGEAGLLSPHNFRMSLGAASQENERAASGSSGASQSGAAQAVPENALRELKSLDDWIAAGCPVAFTPQTVISKPGKQDELLDVLKERISWPQGITKLEIEMVEEGLRKVVKEASFGLVKGPRTGELEDGFYLARYPQMLRFPIGVEAIKAHLRKKNLL